MVQYTLVYINSAKHLKLTMINFQRVNESRRRISQEPHAALRAAVENQ